MSAASRTPGSPARRSNWLSLLLALTVLAILNGNTVDAKAKKLSYTQKKHSTANADQSASLQAGAVKLSAGQYTFTNVQTGQSLTYTASSENVVPASGVGTALAIKQHPNKKTRWLQLHLQGGKTKCLSSQWGKGGNAAAVAYQCNNSGLEKTKQWWIIVPSTRTKVRANKHSAANSLLLAQQAQSDKLHRRDEFDQIEGDDEEEEEEEEESDEEDDETTADETWEEIEEDEEEEADESEFARLMRRSKHKKAKKTKKLSRGKSDGKHYYIIPTDHLMDTAAVALTANRIKTGSAMSTKLRTMKTSNKGQLWKIYKH